MIRFASVVIDVDSTLSRIEGIEWLAKRCSPEVQASIEKTTTAAMSGAIPLEKVYGERLAMVKPTRAEVRALGEAYIEGISPGAREAIATLQQHGVQVAVVSGGLLDAILPLAEYVGVPPELTRAVALSYDDDGVYRDYDRESPVARRGGKPIVVRDLALPSPTLALGDGITDAELAPVVDMFVAFTGVVCHEAVMRAAASSIANFSELPPLVLG